MNTFTPNKPRVAVSNSAGVHSTHNAIPRPPPVPASSNHHDKPCAPSSTTRPVRAPVSNPTRDNKGNRPAPAPETPNSPSPNPNRSSPNRIERTTEDKAPARSRKTGRKIATSRQQKSARLVNQSIRRADDEEKGAEDAKSELDGPPDHDGPPPPPSPSSTGRLPYAPPEPKKLNANGDYCDIDGITEQPIFVPPTKSMVGLGYATLAAPFIVAIALFWSYPVLSAIVLQSLAVIQAYLLFRTDLTALLKYVMLQAVPDQTAPASVSAFLRESYTNPQRSLRLFHCTIVPFLQSLRLVFAPCTYAISGMLCKVGEKVVNVTLVDERLPSVQAVEASNVLARIDLWNCISPSTMLYTTILSSQTIVQQILSRVRALSTEDRDKLAESISARIVNVHIRASLLPDVQRGSAKLASARASASDASDTTIQSAHRLFQSQVSYFLLGALTSIIVLLLKASSGTMIGMFIFHVCVLAPIYEELLKTALASLLGTTRYIPSMMFGVLEYALYVCCSWASPFQRLLPLLMHMYVGTQCTTRAIFNHASYNVGCCLPLILFLLMGPTPLSVPAPMQLPPPDITLTQPVQEPQFKSDMCDQLYKECLIPPFTLCRFFANRMLDDGMEFTECPAYLAYVTMCQESDFCSQVAVTYLPTQPIPATVTDAGKLRLGPLFDASMCRLGRRKLVEMNPRLLGSSIAATIVFLTALATITSKKQKKRLARGIRFACGYRVAEVNLPPPGDHSAKISLTKKFYEACPTRSDSCSLGFTFSKFVPPFPDFCHPATALDGVLKRFCRDPPKPNARKLRSLRRFAERFVRKHYAPLGPDVDSSVETWLAATDYPEWRKKQLLECWWDKPWVVREDFINKSFIKREFYTDFKAARGINSRSDTFKCFSGPYFKLIESQVYAQPCFDGTRLIPGAHNPFIKHIPCHLRPRFLTEMFEGCDGPFYETDYSQFEKHFTPEVMDALELVLYKHMLQHHPHVYSTIVAALRGRNKCCYNAFIIRIAARRMSGDMCTSLGNGFSNLILFNFAAYQKGGTAFGVVEGDDALFKSTVVLTAEDFRSLGFDIKIMSHSFLHLTSFCGMSFSSDGVLLKDPLRVMPKFGWSFSPRRLGSNSTRLSLLKARALSLAYESPRCPIIHALAKRSLEVTEGAQPIFESGYHRAEIKSWIEKFPDVMQQQLTNPPSMQSRIEFAAHFGISVAIQLRVEEIIFSWDGSALDHPVIDLLFNHNSSLQTFAENNVDTNLDSLISQLEVNRQ